MAAPPPVAGARPAPARRWEVALEIGARSLPGGARSRRSRPEAWARTGDQGARARAGLPSGAVSAKKAAWARDKDLAGAGPAPPARKAAARAAPIRLTREVLVGASRRTAQQAKAVLTSAARWRRGQSPVVLTKMTPEQAAVRTGAARRAPARRGQLALLTRKGPGAQSALGPAVASGPTGAVPLAMATRGPLPRRATERRPLGAAWVTTAIATTTGQGDVAVTKARRHERAQTGTARPAGTAPGILGPAHAHWYNGQAAPGAGVRRNGPCPPAGARSRGQGPANCGTRGQPLLRSGRLSPPVEPRAGLGNDLRAWPSRVARTRPELSVPVPRSGRRARRCGPAGPQHPMTTEMSAAPLR